MADLRDEVVGWLYEDFWEIHRDDQACSALVRHILRVHGDAFRVRTKRLCRKAYETCGNVERTEFVRFLVRELMGGQRLTGKTEGGRVRLGPMLRCQSLSVLTNARATTRQEHASWRPCAPDVSDGELRARADETRCLLAELLLRLDTNPASVEDLPMEGLLALADDMLCADRPSGPNPLGGRRANVVETLLELLEDLRRESVTLGGMDAARARAAVESDGFESLVKKLVTRERSLDDLRKSFLLSAADRGPATGVIGALATEEAKQELANMGRPAPLATGEIPEPKAPRKQGLDLALVELYLQEQGSATGDSDALCKDLAQLLRSTCVDDRYAQLFVPAEIDASTGVGLYLMGRGKLAIHALTKAKTLAERRMSTTIVALDDRRAEPRPLLVGEDVRRKGSAANKVWSTEMRRAWTSNVYPVRYDMRLECLEDWLGGSGKRSADEVGDAIKELYEQYLCMSGVSLRESFRRAQGISAPPKECPDRFLRFFG